MMTAKEMFEELGFKLCVDNNTFKIYKNGSDDNPFNWSYVRFSKKDKTYHVDIMIGETYIKLHKAITKQLEELGWIE